MGNSQKITPCLWFDKEAEEAANFYTSLFQNSEISVISRYNEEGLEIHGQPAGQVMTVLFELAGYKFMGLNGGPDFKFNPSISFLVACESEAEVERLWGSLSEGGAVLMELGKYEWSEKYGWLADRYGLSWQLTLLEGPESRQTITPALLFVGEQCGRAEEAANLYTSIFEDSGITRMLRYQEGEAPDRAGTVKHARLTLADQPFTVMDSAYEHDFSFNEAVSLMISCESQEEVDYFWQKLTDGGEEGPCGWLKDRFDVSWQVFPEILGELLQDPDAEKVARVTRAFLQMSKFDIAVLKQAHAGEQVAK